MLRTAPTPVGGQSTAPFVVPDKLTTLFFHCEVHPDQVRGEIAFK
jgi:hypothetical protein